MAQRPDPPAALSVGVDRFSFRLPAGAFSDYWIQRVLARHLAAATFRAGRDFDRLPIPFRAVAADLRSGERVVLSRGSLDLAVRASMSVPVALAPVPIDDRLLVDGGLMDNVPVDAARELGGDLVVAVDVTSPIHDPDRIRDAIDVADRLSDVLTRARNDAYRQPADVTIRPELGALGFSEYAARDTLIALGYQAARAALPAIRALLAGRRSGARHVPQGPELEGRRITEVRVSGNALVAERRVLKAFALRVGQPLSLSGALEAADAVYATDLFDSCRLDFEEDGAAGVRVVVNVREAPRRVAELGVSYDEADELRGFLRLRNRSTLSTMTWDAALSPVRGPGGRVRRNSGASTQSEVTGQIVPLA